MLNDLLLLRPGRGQRVGGRLDRVDGGIKAEVEERPDGFARDIPLVLKRAAMRARGLKATAVGGLGDLVGGSGGAKNR